MKKHILCFGDSNTYGLCADPSDCLDGSSRYPEEQRWTCLLQQKLGDGYLVIEEGLSGRTTCFDDPLYEGLNAMDYLYPCLKSHEPLDLLVIMLGTNDTKDRFRVSPACIALGMARLVKKAQATECWGGNQPNILVIAPPHIGEEMHKTEKAVIRGTGCAEKSRLLARYYQEQCALAGVHFLDAQAMGCQCNTVDFMHLTARGHATLAENLARVIPELLK